MTAAKQTAGNNLFLARVKATFSVPEYATVAKIVNDGGEAQAREYLSRNVVNVTPDMIDGYMVDFIDRVYDGIRDRLPALIR